MRCWSRSSPAAFLRPPSSGPRVSFAGPVCNMRRRDGCGPPAANTSRMRGGLLKMAPCSKHLPVSGGGGGGGGGGGAGHVRRVARTGAVASSPVSVVVSAYKNRLRYPPVASHVHTGTVRPHGKPRRVVTRRINALFSGIGGSPASPSPTFPFLRSLRAHGCFPFLLRLSPSKTNKQPRRARTLSPFFFTSLSFSFRLLIRSTVVFWRNRNRLQRPQTAILARRQAARANGAD